MSVTHDEVRKIARLAELDVDDATLPALAEQMSRILEYVAQINAVPASEGVKPFIPGPDAVRFRPDEVKPSGLAFGPAAFAPAFTSRERLSANTPPSARQPEANGSTRPAGSSNSSAGISSRKRLRMPVACAPKTARRSA